MTEPAATTTNTWAMTLFGVISDRVTDERIYHRTYAKQVINTTNYIFKPIVNTHGSAQHKIGMIHTHDLQLR